MNRLMNKITRPILSQTIASKQGLRAGGNVFLQQQRNLNLHEYQSQDIMRAYGINVPMGRMAASASEARHVAGAMSQLQQNMKKKSNKLVIKAQVHAGGRGKGHFTSGLQGGVHLCDSAGQVGTFAQQMLGSSLITKQTGAGGQKCEKVLIQEGIDIVDEFYFALLLDRATGGPVAVYSPMGGMDIEGVAKTNPEAIFKCPIDVMQGITEENIAEIVKNLGITDGAVASDARQCLFGLYSLFTSLDATQVEINPLVVTSDNKVMCADAKLNIDDSAEYRQQGIFGLRDTSMEDPRDLQAEEIGVEYVGLDGNIGCMVNGAGLAMATMDLITSHGGEPANFLDVGGSARKDQIAGAFKLIVSDPNVKAILVNIFGGIMRCDLIAEGIVYAYQEVDLQVPLIVRLEGTKVEEGKEILKNSGFPIIAADTFEEGAQTAVKAASEGL